MWLFILQRIGIEFLWHIIFFPLWWYSAGLAFAGRAVIGFFQDGNHALAPLLWARNLFVPMYGQTDWQGRIMSVFIRFVNVIVRSVFLAVWGVAAGSLFLFWIAAPMFVVVMLIQSFA